MRARMRRLAVVCAAAAFAAAVLPRGARAQGVKGDPHDLGSLFLDLSKTQLGTISSDNEKKEYLQTVKLEEDRITQSALHIVYQNAYDLYRKGDYNGAKSLTGEILSIDPYYSDAFMLQKASTELNGSSRPLYSQHQLVEDKFQQGMELYRQGRLTEAEEQWSEATKLSPWNFKARYWLDRVREDLARQHFLRGEEAYRQRRLQDALNQWYAALVLKSDYPGLVADIAQAESRLREQEANRKLEDALQLYGQGRIEEALKKIDEVLQYGPGDEKARKLMMELRSEMAQQHASLGRQLYDAGRYDEAVAEWKKAESYGYDPAIATQLIERAHEGIREAALAKAEAKKATQERAVRAKEEARKKAEAAAAAAAKQKQEQQQAAQQQAQQQAAPAAPQASGQISAEARHASEQHYISGMIYYNEGNYEKARQEFSVAKELDPNNSDAEVGLERVQQIFGGGP
ncbi:MAG: tetratricopeptide repeat protein [Elusimicrobia bacterium]|nr:tetratricopeptide repeat protein [Elusimicrobiota bacterium]